MKRLKFLIPEPKWKIGDKFYDKILGKEELETTARLSTSERSIPLVRHRASR